MTMRWTMAATVFTIVMVVGCGGGNDANHAPPAAQPASAERVVTGDAPRSAPPERAAKPDAPATGAPAEEKPAPVEPEAPEPGAAETQPAEPARGLLDAAGDPLRTAQFTDLAPQRSADAAGTGDDEADGEQWTVPLEAFRAYLQPVASPDPLQDLASRTMEAYSMAELQHAIASNTVVTVHGTLQAGNDNCVNIGRDVHDLVVRFAADAEIRFTGEKSYAGVFRIQPGARRLRFESPRIFGPGGSFDTCAGIEFVYDDGPDVAEDISIVDGEFRGLNYAIQAHGGCRRLLVQNCTARELIDYFFYGSKRVEDVSIMNCLAHGMRSNHVIRMFDADRVNIFRNDLKVAHTSGGQMKRTIWILTGRNVTIAANITRDGRITIGPNPVPEESSPADRIGHVNIVCNRIIHTHTNKPINLLSGAHDVFLHGNVITTFSDQWLAIGGWNRHQRPVFNVRWTDGTIHNGATMTGWEGVVVNEHYQGQPDIGPVSTENR